MIDKPKSYLHGFFKDIWDFATKRRDGQNIANVLIAAVDQGELAESAVREILHFVSYGAAAQREEKRAKYFKLYEGIAESLTAEHVMTPVSHVKREEINTIDRVDISVNDQDQIWIVETRDDDPRWPIGRLIETHGFLYSWDIEEDPEEDELRDLICPIHSDQMIGANTSLLELPDYLVRSYRRFADRFSGSESHNLAALHPICHLFVQGEDGIQGTVGFQDFDKAPMRLTLFSLVIRLEEEILDAIRLRRMAKGCFNALKSNLRDKARQEFQRKHGRPYHNFEELIKCTSFDGKVGMFLHLMDQDADKISREDASQTTPENIVDLRFHRWRKELPFKSRREAEEFFKKVRKVRNELVHTGSLLHHLENPKEFQDFLGELRDVHFAVSELREKASDE